MADNDNQLVTHGTPDHWSAPGLLKISEAHMRRIVCERGLKDHNQL